MKTINILRNSLISKILLIRDQELLSALDALASASSEETKVALTSDQKDMIQRGLDDYDEGRTISQDELFEREFKWLNEH